MADVLSDSLFQHVLLNPAEISDSLYIVSGYATAAMAFHHMQSYKDKSLSIKLIVGMSPIDGISESDHKGFQSLMNENSFHLFECSYLVNAPSVHSKLYTWCDGDTPIQSFIGSANYTQRAFGRKQREILSECDPVSSISYFQSLVNDSIYCTHIDATNYIDLYKNRRRARIAMELETIQESGSTEVPFNEDYIGLLHASTSLLTAKGEMPDISGLNWGHRNNRNRNEAYLAIHGDLKFSDFFPEIGAHFTVLTDDEKTLICTREQADGKCITTPHNNSLIGMYFRYRLGLASGAFVTKDDLLRYGRTDVDFYKIDD